SVQPGGLLREGRGGRQGPAGGHPVVPQGGGPGRPGCPQQAETPRRPALVSLRDKELDLAALPAQTGAAGTRQKQQLPPKHPDQLPVLEQEKGIIALARKGARQPEPPAPAAPSRWAS